MDCRSVTENVRKIPVVIESTSMYILPKLAVLPQHVRRHIMYYTAIFINPKNLLR